MLPHALQSSLRLLGAAFALSLTTGGCSSSGGSNSGAGAQSDASPPGADAGGPSGEAAAPEGSTGNDAMADGPRDALAGDASGGDLASYYQAYAVIGCQKSFDCCTSPSGDDPNIAHNWQGAVTSRAGCASVVIPSALATDEAGLLKDIQSGTIVYHPEYAQACLDATSQLSCDHFFDDPELYTPDPCVSLFEGKLALGAVCDLSAQCPPGDGCIGPLSGTHTCQTIPKQGEPCTGYCPVGLYCDSSNKCVPQLPEGAPCTFPPLECLSVCDLTTHTCEAPFPKACEGPACTPNETECMGTSVATCDSTGHWQTTPCAEPTPTCSAGACTCAATVCASEGVCTDTRTDWKNCGGCGQTCPPGENCQGGVCTCPSGQALSNGKCCPTGSTNCNGVCVDENTDSNNCGGCGQKCDTTVRSCRSGACTCTSGQATCSIVQLAAGESGPNGFVLDSTNVYWTTSTGAVRSVSLGGGTPATVASPLSSGCYLGNITADSGNLYAVGDCNNDGSVVTVPKTGGTLRSLASGQNYPQKVAVDSTSVYWINFDGRSVTNSGSLASVLLTGGSPTPLASGLYSPIGIAVDATTIYWADLGGVTSKPIAGGPQNTVLIANPNGFAMDASSVYVTDGGALGPGTGHIFQAPKSGGSHKVLASSLDGPALLAIDATNLYWLNVGLSIDSWSILTMPTSGGPITTLVSGQAAGSVSGIAVDATSVYWYGAGNVMKFTPK